MGVARKNSFRYDGKALWDYYMSLGKAATYGLVMKYALSSGMFNPETGKVTDMGIRYAMWRYAILNPEEAYEGFKKWQMEYGEFPTFEEFCQEVLDHSHGSKSPVVSEIKRKEFAEKYLNG